MIMAFMAYVYVYPCNFDSLSLTYERSGTQYTLSKSDFTSNSTDNRLEYSNSNITSIVSATTSNSYPTPRITEELIGDTQYYCVDFRPEHLYAIGDDTISTTDYIYVDDLTNPTGVYNNQGWASNNAFDWSWHGYSNFYSITYNSSTQKYDISCTEYTGSGGVVVDPVIPTR